MTRAISVYSLWSSSTADIYGKSLTREERKKEWDRFEKKHPEDFAKLQRRADRENKKAGVETKKTKATKATKKTTKKESVKCADGVCKKRAPRKQSLATLEKKLVTAEKNLKKATQAVADIEAAGGEAMYTTTDVTEPAAIKEMVAACVAKFGKLDILFVSDLAASRCSSCTDTRGYECTNALDVSYACLIG